jgi:hypothetical protein
LSTLFPSNDNVEDGGGGVDGSESGGCGGIKRGKGGQQSSGAGTAHLDRDFVSAGTDRPSPRRHNSIPVRFTKNAVELLRETLNAFLRRVGRDILEELDAGDPMSQHPIRPEDVVKVLLALDGDNETTTTTTTTTASIDEEDSNGERTRTTTPTTNSNTASSHGEMKELVSQAQNLLLPRKRRECKQNQEPERLNKRKIIIEPNTDNPTGGGTKDSMGGSTCGPDHESKNNNNNNDTKSFAAAAASTNAARTTLSTQQQQPKKRKRKRKKQKIIITAEMEAEQERLLNASKKALDSSRQQQNGGGNDAPTFRVELS